MNQPPSVEDLRRAEQFIDTFMLVIVAIPLTIYLLWIPYAIYRQLKKINEKLERAAWFQEQSYRKREEITG